MSLLQLEGTTFFLYLVLTIDSKLAVGVKNQLLDVLLFSLFQRFAGSLVNTHSQDSLVHLWLLLAMA